MGINPRTGAAEFKTLGIGRLEGASDRQKRGFILETGGTPCGWQDFGVILSGLKFYLFSSGESVKEVWGGVDSFGGVLTVPVKVTDLFGV